MYMTLDGAEIDAPLLDQLLSLLGMQVPGVDVTDFTLSLAVDAASLPTLAVSGVPAVRCALARHPHTPRAVLETLAQDSNPKVLWAVSQRRRLPPSVATAILRNPAAYQADDQWAALACFCALACPTLDPAVVARAAQHPSPFVQHRAQQHPRYPGAPAEATPS